MGKIFATILLHFVIPLKIDMQHDHVLKKSNFDLLTPTPGSRGGWTAGTIFATMLPNL